MVTNEKNHYKDDLSYFIGRGMEGKQNKKGRKYCDMIVGILPVLYLARLLCTVVLKKITGCYC